jgi:predicted kinase
MSRREREREREARRERGRVAHTGPAPLMPVYPEVLAPAAPVEPEASVVRKAPAEAGRPAARREGPPRGTVVLAIGLPGSGKTSWFRRRGVTPLSSDMMRHLLFDDATEQSHQNLVFSTLRTMLRARLMVSMPMNYVDATNLSPNERRQWIEMAESFGYEVQAVFFDVPLELCMERNRKRQRTVSDEAMQRLAEKLVPPKFEEGFSKITVVRVKKGKAE